MKHASAKRRGQLSLLCFLLGAVMTVCALSACNKAPKEESSDGASSATESNLPAVPEYDFPAKVVYHGKVYEVTFAPGENGLCMTVTDGKNGTLTAVCTENGSYRVRTESLDGTTDVTETRTEFDGQGNVLLVTESNGNVSHRMEYENGLLRRRITTHASGSTTTEEYTYDKNGRLTTCFYRNGERMLSETVYEYDGDLLVKRSSRMEGMETPDTVTYEYDAQGRKIAETHRSAYSFSEKEEIYSWEYNEQGDVVTEIYPSIGGIENAIYRKNEYTYEYDEAGRKVKMTRLDGGEALFERSFSYQGGQILTVTAYPDGRIHETVYESEDSDNRLKCIYRDADGAEDVRFDILERSPVAMTDAQYDYFLAVLLHMNLDLSISLKDNC